MLLTCRPNASPQSVEASWYVFGLSMVGLAWHYQEFSGPLGVGRSPSRKEKIICKARRRSIWAARRRRNIRDGHDALVCIELTAFIDNNRT